MGVVDPCSLGRARAPLFGLSQPLLSVGWPFVTWVRSPLALCSLGGSHSLLFGWCYSLLFWRISLLIFNQNRSLLYWQVTLCPSSAVAPFLWGEVIPCSSGTSHGLLFLQDWLRVPCPLADPCALGVMRPSIPLLVWESLARLRVVAIAPYSSGTVGPCSLDIAGPCSSAQRAWVFL